MRLWPQGGAQDSTETRDRLALLTTSPDPGSPALSSISCLPHSFESRPRSPYFKTEPGSGLSAVF